MKKLMIAFLCCFGVGLAMMASPAQVSDDDITVDAKNKTAVQTSVSERNGVSTHQTPLRIKHEFKKVIDFSNLKSSPVIPQRPDFDPDKMLSEKSATKHPVPGGRIIIPHGDPGSGSRVDVTLSEWSTGGNGNETETFTVPTRDR
jgi:hypothetical protein